MQELLTNKLLTALPAGDLARLMPALAPVALSAGQTFMEGDNLNHLFFPESCVFSYHCAMQDGESVEVGMIGPEGVTGLGAFFGARPTMAAQTLGVTIGGKALRVKAGVIEQERERCAALRQALLRYTGAYYVQVSQRSACNALHTVEKRFAVWLLLLNDRLSAGQFALTQERMAAHLGARRAGISVLAMRLQNRGAISYKRGHIRILDRELLAAVACECYELLSRTAEPGSA